MAEKVKPAPEEQPAMMDSAVVAPTPQPATTPAGQQQLSQANENVAPGRQRRNPAASTTRQAEQARLESVVQEEPVQQENQRIVEADLTEIPSDIQPQPRTGTAETKPVARVIQGKVSSTEDGAALQGVNVLVKGTSIGTITDAEGNYQITLNDPAQTLMFSFIGLKDVAVSPTGKRDLNVEMSPDLAQLSEVVVAGYGADGNTATLRLAEPKGGRNAFQKYLKEKMNYPEQALENKVEGRVTVQFTVDANGQLGEFKILNGIGYGCDDEVIRLIKEGPAWMPSQRNDQPVKEKVKVRLMFDIPN
jgi:TonB family protein